MKKTNHFISFKFFDIEQLVIMKLLRGATIFVSILKAYETSRKKYSSPTNDFITLIKCRIENVPSMTPLTANFLGLFLSKQNKKYNVNLLKSGLTTEQAFMKSELSPPPPT